MAQALETHRTPWKATQSADRRPSWQTLWKPGADESRHIRPPLEIENRTVDVPRAANGIEGREQIRELIDIGQLLTAPALMIPCLGFVEKAVETDPLEAAFLTNNRR